MWVMTISPPSSPKWMFFSIILVSIIVVVVVLRRFLQPIGFSYQEKYEKMVLIPAEFLFIFSILKIKEGHFRKCFVFKDQNDGELASLKKRFFALTPFEMEIKGNNKVLSRSKNVFSLAGKRDKIVIVDEDLEEKGIIQFGKTFISEETQL